MPGSSNNDAHIIQQFNLGLKLHDVKQLEGVDKLSEDQLYCLYGLFKRLIIGIQDFEGFIRKERTLKFENRIERWLKKKGVAYKTEKQLRDMNIYLQKNGEKALPTPDFLIEHGLRDIKWIECKNYYGSTDNTLRKVLNFETLGKKYSKHYGKGVIIFSKGFNSDLKPPPGVRYVSV